MPKIEAYSVISKTHMQSTQPVNTVASTPSMVKLPTCQHLISHPLRIPEETGLDKRPDGLPEDLVNIPDPVPAPEVVGSQDRFIP